MTVVTSKPSPVQIGQARNKETIYTATRTTKMADGTYSVEMLQYSNAKGQGGKVIAERDSVNEWTFKDGVSKKIKQNEGRLNEASKNQMESMRGDFVTKSQETEEYNRAQGEPNKATETETGDSQVSVTSPPSGTRDFGDMFYPLDIATSGQDVITFTALTYSVKTLTGFTFGGRPRVTSGGGGSRSKGTVTLPIQSGIKDQNSAGWGEETMDPAQIALAGFALSGIGALGEFSALNESLSNYGVPEDQQLGVKDALIAALPGPTLQGQYTNALNQFNENMMENVRDDMFNAAFADTSVPSRGDFAGFPGDPAQGSDGGSDDGGSSTGSSGGGMSDGVGDNPI